MKVITAINEDYSVKTNNSKSIFLAGGITNCPDWQQEAISIFEKVSAFDFVLYNPRRKDFPIGDPNASEQQITWEYNHLKEAHVILFWFSRGSMNPIVLYELGMWGNSNWRKIYIGVDPEYERKQDVYIQTALARPDIKIYKDLNEMCLDIIGKEITDGHN